MILHRLPICPKQPESGFQHEHVRGAMVAQPCRRPDDGFVVMVLDQILIRSLRKSPDDQVFALLFVTAGAKTCPVYRNGAEVRRLRQVRDHRSYRSLAVCWKQKLVSVNKGDEICVTAVPSHDLGVGRQLRGLSWCAGKGDVCNNAGLGEIG